MEKTLIDRFDEFQTKVRDLQQKPQNLQGELSVKSAKLERLKMARSSQLALDETEKAKVLAKEIEKLQEEVDTIEAKISAHGPGGRDSAQALVANAPGSDLYNLAVSIVEQAAEIAPPLEKELKYFIDWGAGEEKRKYLDKISEFANKLAELWGILEAGLTAQKYLPEHLRQCKKPRLIAPMQSSFEVDVMQVGTVYKPLSKVFLPD